MLVPVLILLAAVLLAVQDRPGTGYACTRDTTVPMAGGAGARPSRSACPQSTGDIWAGLSVIILAVLGLFLDDTLTRLNALKQCISLGTNVAAAVFFLFQVLSCGPSRW